MGAPAHLALSPKAEGGVIAGKGNCPHGDNNSEFIRMQPGIPMKSQVRHRGSGMSAVLARRGRRATKPLPPPPPTSQFGCPSPHGTSPSASPERAWRSSCTRKLGISASKSRWLLAPKWGSPMSSKEDTSVSLNCLGLHSSFRCPPRAPSLARCGAAVCLFSKWDCRGTPEDEKAQDRDRKAAARRSPMEMLHLLHLFLFCWYFNLSAKTNSKLQDLVWSFVFSADFSAYHHILLCSRQCVLLGFVWHQAAQAGAIGRLWYIKNR